MKLQEYDSEQLEGIMNELAQLVDKYQERNPPLAKILARDMGEIVREMFLRLASDGDQVRRRELAEYWESHQALENEEE